jgi:hypothetical protein
MLVFFLLSFSFNYGYPTCSNYSTGGTCNFRPFPCSQYSGWTACLCVTGCLQISGNPTSHCVNKTLSLPQTQIIYPSKCNQRKYINNDVNCNYGGVGTVCPLNCSYYGNKCNSQYAICYPQKEWTCPLQCYYDKNKKICLPSNSYSICNLINNSLTCPYGCQYNNNLGKCIGTAPNNVCYLQLQLKCPGDCILNPRGDTCIPQATTINAICDKVVIPQCPLNCQYDNNNKICKPKIPNTICEPIVRNTCLYNGFTKNIDKFPICNNMMNTYNICTDYYTTVWYPLRLKLKYNSMFMCEYSNDQKCDSKRIAQTCCNY